MKNCSRCKVQKELTEFNKSSSSVSGLRSDCRACQADYSKKNKAKLNKQRRDWYLDNSASVKQKARQYRLDNLEQVNARLKKWREENALATRNHKHERRAKLKSNGIFLVTKRDIRRILDNPCAYCGKPGKVELDHVLPISRGGRHSIGNLVAACISCNRSKGSKTLFEWKKDR